MVQNGMKAALVTGMAATLLLGGLAFVAGPAAPSGGATRTGAALRGTALPAGSGRPAAGSLTVAMPLVALGALAAATRRRLGKVAAKAVLTTDAQGRFRFVTDGAAPAAPTAAGMEWAGEIGATLPLCEPKDGMTRWDPVGFTAGANAVNFDKYRAAELKHGRVAMIATVGLVAQHSFKLPYIITPDGFISLENVPSGFGAISTAPASYAFGLLVLAAGILELGVLSDKGRAAGDFGDPWGWKKEISYTGLGEKQLKTYELEHGRLAMFGVIGTLAAEYLTGNDAVQQWENAVVGGGKLLKYTLYWA